VIDLDKTYLETGRVANDCNEAAGSRQAFEWWLCAERDGTEPAPQRTWLKIACIPEKLLVLGGYGSASSIQKFVGTGRALGRCPNTLSVVVKILAS
jgi:hypothetical protein